MRTWLRRLRGLFGMGTIGALAGAIFGIGMAILERIGPAGSFTFSMGFFATLYGVIGGATGVGFGLLLAGTSGRRRLEEVSRKRVGAVGAAAGLSVPLLVGITISGAFPPAATAAVVASVGGVVGAAVGVGLLAVAKRADQADKLRGAAEVPRLE